MIDTHCHIDLYQDPLATAKEVEQRRIIVIAVTNLPSHFEIGYPQFLKFKRIRPALGLHPLMAQHHKKELIIFKRMLPKTSYIGEIGLDFSRDGKDTKDIQVESLRFVLDNIRNRPRFVSLHSRGAESAVLNLLEEFGIKRTVFHWYSGSLNIIEQAIKSGHYFSVNPAMVQSKKGRRIIERIPIDRLLTESDGPYVQLRNQPVQPGDVRLVLDVLKNIWGLSIEETKMRVDSNFKTLISPLLIS
jgi:TatD DNase family protein